MRKYKKVTRVRSIYPIILAIFLGMALAVGGSVWATSIGTNVSVSGTLDATGNTSLNADLTVSSGARVGTGSTAGHLTALADDSFFVEGESEFDGIAWFDDSLRASSTLLVTGASTLYGALTVNGNVTLGDASGDTLTVTGNSITYSNAGTTTIPSANADAWAYATSSANIPLLKLDTNNTRVGISTTTPGSTLAVGGDGLLMGGGTTTLSIQSTSATRGGCIELETADGAGRVRIYAAVAATSTVIVESGSCR